MNSNAFDFNLFKETFVHSISELQQKTADNKNIQNEVEVLREEVLRLKTELSECKESKFLTEQNVHVDLAVPSNEITVNDHKTNEYYLEVINQLKSECEALKMDNLKKSHLISQLSSDNKNLTYQIGLLQNKGMTSKELMAQLTDKIESLECLYENYRKQVNDQKKVTREVEVATSHYSCLLAQQQLKYEESKKALEQLLSEKSLLEMELRIKNQAVTNPMSGVNLVEKSMFDYNSTRDNRTILNEIEQTQKKILGSFEKQNQEYEDLEKRAVVTHENMCQLQQELNQMHITMNEKDEQIMTLKKEINDAKNIEGN